MKTTVEYRKVSYQQANEKTVVCNLLFRIQYWKVKNIEHFLNIPDVTAFVKDYVDKNGDILMHVSAKSMCCPTDTFSFEKGRRIAFTRAQMKAFDMTSDFYDELLRRATIDIVNTSDNCVLSGDNCDSHIVKLMNE